MRRLSALLAVVRTALLPLIVGSGALAAPALAQDVSEYGMKAVLFYRLSQFVYWPGTQPAPRPTVLCVAGRNPFGNALSQIDASSGDVSVRQAPADLAACHLLFIPRSESASLAAWLERTGGKPIVTVSDVPGFARAGGMIELPLEGGRVAIVLNRAAAQERGFEFNAQLLRLARVVDR